MSSMFLPSLYSISQHVPLILSYQHKQQTIILDPESDGERVLSFVGGLLSKLNALQDKAFTYKSYQKSFKVSTIHSILRVHLYVLSQGFY